MDEIPTSTGRSRVTMAGTGDVLFEGTNDDAADVARCFMHIHQSWIRQFNLPSHNAGFLQFEHRDSARPEGFYPPPTG